MKTDSRMIAFACVGIAVAAIVWARAPTSAAGAQGAITDAAARLDSPTMPWREYLAAYWGAKWSDMEAQIPLEKRMTLDRVISTSDIAPWSDVEPTLRTAIREGVLSRRDQWIEAIRDKDRDAILTGAVLGSDARPLTDVEQVQLQAIVDRYAPHLEALAAAAFDLAVEAEDAMWNAGRICVCPLIEICPPEPKGHRAQLIVRRCYSSNCWIVSYAVDSSEWPDLDDTLSHVALLQSERKREVLEYLRHT